MDWSSYVCSSDLQSWSRPRRYKHRRSAAKKMFSDVALSRSLSSLALTSAIVDALREATTSQALAALMNAVTRAMGFRHFALIHHDDLRSDKHTSELQSLMRISYAVFCLKKTQH